MQTDYIYDELNRIENRNYSTPGSTPNNYQASPNVTYTYGTAAPAIGQLTKVSTGVGPNTSTTEYVEFDILGRVKRSIQTTDGITYGDGTDESRWMTYDYNLSGALIEQQYPSGRRVRNELDESGNLATVQSKKNASHAYWNYANRFSYNAAGAVTSMQLGNGRWESTQFNSRLQPTQIALGKIQNATDLLRLDYQYGDLQWNGSVDTQKNNGNVAKQTITVPSVGATAGFTAVQNYDYDSLNRIQIASETLTPTSGTAESWVQEFRYDRYGNRTFHEPTTTLPKECGTAPSLTVCPDVVPIVNPSVNSANNRLNGYSFDDAGNTTRDAQNRKFTYDAENKQTKVETLTGETVTGTIGEYWYDGDGKRIKKRGYTNNVLTEETIFLYDASGQLIGEYSNESAPARDAKIAYLTNDHLGSPRVNTDINGNLTSRHDYHPFGEEVTSSHRVLGLGYRGSTIRKKFTGYERDTETSLDSAGARMYSSRLGRFSAADIPFADQAEEDPQSWSLYSYVRNLPTRYVDPTGLWRRVECTDHTLDGAICVESDRDDDTYETLAQFLKVGNLRDLKNFFRNETIRPGETVFEVSDFVYKIRVPTDPGGSEVGMDLFFAAQSGRGLASIIWNGAKAAGKGALSLFTAGASRSAPQVIDTAASNLPAAIPHVSNPRLANLVKDLYKGARSSNRIGTGSTADAVRHELATGTQVGGRWHSTKASEYAVALEKWIRRNPQASQRDLMVARSLLNDLKSALAGK